MALLSFLGIINVWRIRSMMIDCNQAILAMVRELVLNGLGNLDARVYLFGSWARGQQRPSSDIDVAIEAVHGVPQSTLIMIRDSLEESRVPYRVDIVDLAKAGREFGEAVKKEGILWRDYRNDWS